MNPRTRIALAAAVSLGFGTIALASSVHYKGGANAGPSFRDNGVTLTANVCFSGLGQLTTLIELDCDGIPTSTCHNRGNNEPPGQNPASIDVSGDLTVDSSQIKNGNLCVAVTTDTPDTPSPEEAGCPSDNNWRVTLDDVQFTSCEIRVSQGGEVVFDDPNAL